DLITADKSADNVSVLLGNGNGTFAAAQNFATDANPVAVAVADVNGDTRLDLVTANSSGTISVLVGNGDGTFLAPPNPPPRPAPPARAPARRYGRRRPRPPRRRPGGRRRRGLAKHRAPAAVPAAAERLYRHGPPRGGRGRRQPRRPRRPHYRQRR